MDRMMLDFVRLVSEMRAVQKEYFRTHDKVVLQNSKMLEKSVDAKLEQFKQGCYQQTLFMEQHGDNNVMLDTLHGDVVIR